MNITLRVVGHVYAIEDSEPNTFGFSLTVEGLLDIEDARRFSRHMRSMLDLYFEKIMPDAQITGGTGRPPQQPPVDPLPPSRSETYAVDFLKLNVGDGPDQLITLPASIVADLLTDISAWREIALRKQRAH